MGKGYVENSLKRFLKRKVKITLGVVVSFLITGMVSFAENNKPENWLEGIGVEKNLSNKEFKFDDKHFIKIENNELNIIVEQKENKIFLKNLSNKAFENIEIALENVDIVENGEIKDRLSYVNGAFEEYNKYLKVEGNVQGNKAEGIEKIKVLDGSILTAEAIELGEDGKITQYTDGDITNSLSKTSTMTLAKNGGILINKEKIDNSEALSSKVFQTAVNNSQIYNYGKIKVKGLAQLGIKNSAVYNYGEIDGEYYWGDAQIVAENSKAYNFGIIKGGQQIINKSVGYNYGKIIGTQYISDSKVYNYGVIIGNQQMLYYKGEDGENLNAKDISKMVNYGYILGHQDIGLEKTLSSNTGRVDIFKGGEIINYGILSSQTAYNNNVKAYNYGIISNFHKNAVTQHAGGNNIIVYNYGLIENYNKKSYGQDINSENLDAYNSIVNNYGIIKSSGLGQQITKGKNNNKYYNNKSYNYGIINSGVGIKIENLANVEEKNKNIGYNYGIIINKGKATIIENNLEKEINFATQGNVINNGIIIAVDNGTGEMIEGGVNNGVIYKDNSFTIGVDTKNLTDSKKISEIQENNIFVNNLNKDRNVTLTVDKDTLENKHITTIVGKESSVNTIINSIGSLALNDSSIVGYFEKDGTLLNVNGNLTLSGNSVINAIAGNEYTGYKGNTLNNVVAVKLSDNGILTIGENSKVLGAVKGNGTLIYENIDDEFYSNTQEVGSAVIRTTDKNTTNITLANLTLKDSGTGVDNAGKLIIDNQSSEKLKDKEVSTTITLANNINIEKGIDGSSSANGIELILGDGQASSDKTINIDSITLGTGDDILTINNVLEKVGVIDGNKGNDTVNLKISAGDTFDYKLKNIDTLDLGTHTWKIGANAEITHDTIIKADGKTTIQNGTLMGELKGTVETSAEFVNKDNVNNVLGNSTFGENAKFQIGIGKDMKLEAGGEYNLDDTTKNNLENIKDNIVTSAIFTTAKADTSKELRVKSAKEMNIDERYSGIYEEMLKNASSNSEILDTLNSSDVSSIANAINGKGALGDTLATTGYKITRDISNSFMSAVNEWGKKQIKVNG